MKKLLGIVVLSLLLSGSAFAAQDKIVYSSDKFIIVKLDNDGGSLTGGDKFYNAVFGARYWNVSFQNMKIPKYNLFLIYQITLSIQEERE